MYSLKGSKTTSTDDVEGIKNFHVFFVQLYSHSPH